MEDTNTITIDNAPHWLNHSHVVIKADFLAEDQEWIANQSTQVINPGTTFARVESKLGSANLLVVKRMVIEGIVAVKRHGGRIKTVRLPQESHLLLASDLDYIVAQINKFNEPMTEEEQTDFLPSANGLSAEHLKRVK